MARWLRNVRSPSRRRRGPPPALGREDRVALLRGLPGFETLPADVLSEVAERLGEEHYGAGDVIVREGKRGDRGTALWRELHAIRRRAWQEPEYLAEHA